MLLHGRPQASSSFGSGIAATQLRFPAFERHGPREASSEIAGQYLSRFAILPRMEAEWARWPSWSSKPAYPLIPGW